jgi:hypothetical protein
MGGEYCPAAKTSPVLVERLLGASDDSEVLVGGQSLAIWVARYDIEVPPYIPAISGDTDFLARSSAARDSVEKFATAIGGRSIFPSRMARTALVGQVELRLSDTEYVNVDVIHKLIGLDAKKVRERAMRVDLGEHNFLVMHPLDVLRSRLANLYKLSEKQTENGILQLELAICVAREFLRSKASQFSAAETGSGRSPIQTMVSEIEKLALGDAGRKVAVRWGPHVADAIDPLLIPAGPFWTLKWPTLKTLMSKAYGAQFTPPVAAATSPTTTPAPEAGRVRRKP